MLPAAINQRMEYRQRQVVERENIGVIDGGLYQQWMDDRKTILTNRVNDVTIEDC